MVFISICMTAKNEEKTLPFIVSKYHYLLEELGYDYEIVVLDNGSTDNTSVCCQFLEITYPTVRCLRNNVSKEYLGAMKQVIGACKGLYVFFTDADGQYEPVEMLGFLKKVENYSGDFMLIGNKVKRQDPLTRKIETNVFHFFAGLVLHKWFKDPNCGFRLMSYSVAYNIVPGLKWLQYSPGTELTYRAWKKGIDIEHISVNHYPRLFGRSKISTIHIFLRMINNQLHGLYHLWRDLAN